MSALKREEKESRRKRKEEDLVVPRLENPSQLQEKASSPNFKAYQKWLGFVRPRVALGLDRLPREHQPAMASKPRGLSLCFEKVQGWTIPGHLFEDIDLRGYRVSVQLSLSMFHTVSRTFFGTTWMGSPIPIASSDKEVSGSMVVDFDCNDLLYLITRLQDKTCVAVIEIVASSIDQDNDVLVSQHGCGWTMLTLFANKVTDISRGYDLGSQMSSTIYSGSPRDLILKKNAFDEKELHEVNGCALHYRVFESWKLLKIQSLVSENAVLGRFEIIAGLKPKPVTPPGEIKTKMIPCIGDKEEMLGKQGVRVVPTIPQLAPAMSLTLVDWHLLIPNRARFESRVRVEATRQMQLQQAADSQIISRAVKIGLHNGHTLVNRENEWHHVVLEDDDADPDVLLLPASRQSVTVEGYSPHEFVALVFLVEYEIGIHKPEATQYDVHTTIDAIFGDKDVLYTTVSVGASVHIPFDGTHFQLKNISDESDTGEDELNIELDLLPNQICQLLSQNLVFRDQDFKRRVAAASRAAVSKDEDQDTAYENPAIGFDLKVFDRHRKEYRHMDRLDSDYDDDEDSTRVRDEDEADIRRPPRSPQRPVRFTKSDHPPRVKDDDVESIISEPSLVGGSSESSSLRLDPQYYMKSHPQYLETVHESAPQQPLGLTLQLPSGRDSSLLARSMETRLEGTGKLVNNRPEITELSNRHISQSFDKRSMLSDDSERERGFIRHTYSRPTPTPHVVTDHSAKSDVKELSRAARSRLSRHGFSDAMADSGDHYGAGSHDSMRRSMRPVAQLETPQSLLDIEAEAKDELNVHEINIQFAGYRPSYPRASPGDDRDPPRGASPHCVFFSFQFFNCRPTRTEVMRLLPSSSSEHDFNVLVRDEPNSSRHEAPLVLRYVINASEVSPLEAIEFAEYLAHGTLYVDVWDADSLMHIGTLALPLHSLMRQGKSVAKVGLESNVVNSEAGMKADRGGIYTTVISHGSAPSGTVVGAVNVLMSNYGQKGKPSAQSKDERKKHPEAEGEGLNWRAVDEVRKGPSNASKNRPKMSVRAKPLAESTPELSTVLKERRLLDEGNYAARSLSTVRGTGVHTLSYDDVIVLCKRFQGSEKGTIQYSGPLMKLLDLPNSTRSMSKFLKLFRACNSKGLDFKRFLYQHADGGGRLSMLDFKEFLRDAFEQFAIVSSSEENAIISQKVFSLQTKSIEREAPAKVIQAEEVVNFCVQEVKRQDWVVASRRLLRSVQKAYLAGADVEQLLAERDENGDNAISIDSFRMFLKDDLSRYGKLSENDTNATVMHFLRPGKSSEAAISLREFVAFLGKKYVGNVRTRLRDLLCDSCHEDQKWEISNESVLTLAKAKQPSNRDGGGPLSPRTMELCHKRISYEEFDERLKRLNVFESLSHQQVRDLLQTIGSSEGVSVVDFLDHIGASHDLHSREQGKGKKTNLSVDELLALLKERSQTDDGNLTFDKTFRFIDADGDGTVTAEELQSGIQQLHLFNDIDGWQERIPDIVDKFDSDGDGIVSLKEFFAYFGYKDYIPNTIQRITMIFATSGISLDDIFKEIDSDDTGSFTADMLRSTLNAIGGTLGDLSEQDVQSMIEQFDEDGDGRISREEFQSYFEERVANAKRERKKKARKRIQTRLRLVLMQVLNDGGSLEQIFQHFKDEGDVIGREQLINGLKTMDHFKSLSDEELKTLWIELDTDHDGTISFQELEAFMSSASKPTCSAPKATNGVDQSKTTRRSEEKEEESKPSSKNSSNAPSLKSRFIKMVRRIADSEDGGLTGMLAYLDDDEDGLISQRILFRYFRREHMFADRESKEAKNDVLDERDVEDMLEPMIRKDGLIRVDALLSFLKSSGEESSALYSPAPFEDEEDLDTAPKVDDYEFSKNPDTLVLEKKLRRLGGTLAKKGMDVEGLFKSYDTRLSGMVRRSQFLEILSKLGLYLLEKGNVGTDADDDVLSRKQQQQLARIRQSGRSGDYSNSAIQTASRMSKLSGGHHSGDFKDHLESMAMVNWYRQSQKRMLLQRVLSHSLASVVHLYPKFAKTLFFEFPLANPFGHEERFLIEISHPDLRIVTSFDEWTNLRNSCRPSYGSIGDDPVEAEMFDADSTGGVQVALLPQETLHIPFTFVTFEPHFQPSPTKARRSRQAESKSEEDDPEVSRTITVRIISGSHGHVISVLKVHIHPRPFVVHRNITFYEPENSVMRRRIRLCGLDRRSQVPGVGNGEVGKYVHCVEAGAGAGRGDGGQVLVEWGPGEGEGLSLTIRYRCSEFPAVGSFYLVLYNDPHQCSLYEVSVHTRQKLDLHCILGNSTSLDLVVRGDRYARRARAFHSAIAGGGPNPATGLDQVSMRPDTPFQLVPGAYNRVVLSYLPRNLGTGRVQVSVVDVDTRELISAWLLFTTAASPTVTRSYDVEVTPARPSQKKIIFKNPWDMSRKFRLVSSNEDVMRPRTEELDVAGQGSVYLKLWFSKGQAGSPQQDVYLFLNDPSGRTEECFLFQVFTAK